MLTKNKAIISSSWVFISQEKKTQQQQKTLLGPPTSPDYTFSRCLAHMYGSSRRPLSREAQRGFKNGFGDI